jgi:hypothetical protein
MEHGHAMQDRQVWRLGGTLLTNSPASAPLYLRSFDDRSFAAGDTLLNVRSAVSPALLKVPHREPAVVRELTAAISAGSWRGTS